jgi:biotin operon repressor
MERENNNYQSRTVILKDEALRRFQGGFTSVPNVVLRNGKYSLGARMSYVMLLSYAWQDNFCFPAQERLAQDLGVSERSVRTFLKELRENKLIDWKQQGLNRPNIYTLLKLPELDEKDLINQGVENIAGPERKQTSGQERKQASDYKDTVNNTNVNVAFKKAKQDFDGSERLQPVEPIEVAMRSHALVKDILAKFPNDQKSTAFYHKIARLLPEEAIRADLKTVSYDTMVDPNGKGHVRNPAAVFTNRLKDTAKRLGVQL